MWYLEVLLHCGDNLDTVLLLPRHLHCDVNTDLNRAIMTTLISNAVRTTRFWNIFTSYAYQVRHIILKSVGAIKPTNLNRVLC